LYYAGRLANVDVMAIEDLLDRDSDSKSDFDGDFED